MTYRKWTDQDIEHIKSELSTCKAEECKKKLAELNIDYTAVRHVFYRRGLGTPMQYCSDGIPPAPAPKDEWMHIGAFSDMHLGSKHAKIDDINRVFNKAYDAGCRVFTVSGDLVQGHSVKGNQLWENVANGFDEQVDYAAKVLPRREGCTWHVVPGNHDDRFGFLVGANVGRLIEDRFRAAGRHDLFAYPSARAIIDIGGVRVELWHPHGHKPQNAQQPLRRHVDSYPVGHEPHVIIAGHWHDAGWWEHRGIQLVACPSFQGYGGPFSASLPTGACAVGGIILSWVWKNGAFSRFCVEPVTRYDYCQAVELRAA